MQFPRLFCVTTVAALSALAAPAEDLGEFWAGRAEYMSACAACHGDAADGNGPIATMFRDPVPDLRKLAARNGGEFPMLAVIQTIDGRAVIRAHGDPMPLFGSRYRTEATELAGAYGAESIARSRVLELALYLQSIQE